MHVTHILPLLFVCAIGGMYSKSKRVYVGTFTTSPYNCLN